MLAFYVYVKLRFMFKLKFFRKMKTYLEDRGSQNFLNGLMRREKKKEQTVR